MKRRAGAAAPMIALAGAIALALTACGGGDSGGGGGSASGSGDGGGKVTITVGNMPTKDQPALREDFERRMKEFTDANKDIEVKAEETEWKADTWGALLAGGTMPTVIGAPYTEVNSMIEQGQIADVTEAMKSSTVKLNPSVLAVVQRDGKTFGFPIEAWTMGLLYNRDLFTKAGLDPDKPPTSWDEVRTAAKTITEKTGVQGFMTMTAQNTGGWVLTTMSYAFGSTLENPKGTEATIDNDATKKVLDLYKSMRWDDKSMGENFLLNYDDAVKQFAAGQAGMFVQGADNYTNMVIKNGMDKTHFGVAPLPQASGGLGTLAGGTVEVFSPKATPEQLAAAVKWVEFMKFNKYTSQDAAVSEAKAGAADGVAVGEPMLPVVDKSVYDQWLGWVKEYVNVPRENFTTFLDSVDKVALVPEPPVKAQELYATLDNVVQSVLTDQGSDAGTLLKDAQAQFSSNLG